MSKMIQKQIKRSMPVVLIFVLISSMVMGIVFNYDIRLTELPKELGSKVKLAFNLPEANAAKNWATTTVTVRNAPPTFNGVAAEVVASTSTSPVNVGDSISFSGTGDDPESQDFYLIVCSGAVTPRNGLPPICNGGTTFCVSGATGDNTPATCTYSPVAAGLPESQSWNAYVCDAHATEADCSTADTGIGDSSSPFWVNHRPTLVDVLTTDNNKDPGQQITITATTTDTDAGGGADWDTIELSICSSNSWATSTGCAATTLCTASTTLTSGSATPISCNYTIPSPQMHGNTTYYAFIKDLHQLAASASDNSTYATNDVMPVLGTVYINGGSNITPNIKGGTNITASSSVQATDNNGCNDMVDATSTIYWSNVANGSDCTADNNSCYQMAAASCAPVAGCSGAIADFICSTTVAYLVNPTSGDGTDNNSRWNDNWLAKITVYDGSNSTSSISGTGIEVITSSALDVTEASVPYGTIRSSFNSGTSNATTTIVNAGNSPIDTYVKGIDMTGPDTIAVTEQKWNMTNFDYSGGGTVLQLTDVLAAINVSKPTSTDLSSPLYWGINIPAAKPSGTYTGSNTFSVLLYDGVSW